MFLLLLSIISYHYDTTHRKRSIHASHEHGDTVHTFASTLSNNHSMKSAYGMHMRESVSFARFQCAQMRVVFVHQGLAGSSHASFRASTGSSVDRMCIIVDRPFVTHLSCRLTRREPCVQDRPAAGRLNQWHLPCGNCGHPRDVPPIGSQSLCFDYMELSGPRYPSDVRNRLALHPTLPPKCAIGRHGYSTNRLGYDSCLPRIPTLYDS
jgi:hypothetical protein